MNEPTPPKNRNEKADGELQEIEKILESGKMVI